MWTDRQTDRYAKLKIAFCRNFLRSANAILLLY
jgi:hypothetical protein